MSAHPQAFITPQIARWARERANATIDVVAERLNTKAESISSWESGDAYPTMRQAERLARSLCIPLGYLFLSKPPEEKLPLADFRTVGRGSNARPSADLLDTINDVLLKQEWYREELENEGRTPLPFVGRFSSNADSALIAADISRTLSINESMRTASATWQDLMRGIVRSCSLVGLLVMRSGVVGSNTRRPLSVSEFRGFASVDPYAPVVFVNSADAPPAQIFTLAHEIAHIWIGANGVSNSDLHSNRSLQSNDTERLCNEVAAEVLAPKEDFLRRWVSRDSLSQNLAKLGRHFRVSSLVLLRRAYDLGRINRAQFTENYEREATRGFVRTAEPGGDFYNSFFARNSIPLTSALLEAALERRVLLADAARLLNVKVAVIAKAAVKLQERNQS